VLRVGENRQLSGEGRGVGGVQTSRRQEGRDGWLDEWRQYAHAVEEKKKSQLEQRDGSYSSDCDDEFMDTQLYHHCCPL